MTAPDPHEAMRDAVRNALRELLPDVVGGPPTHDGRTAGNGDAATNGHAATNRHAAADRHGTPPSERNPGHEPEVVPLVPAPPVAAVLRPSNWSGPAVPGEVIGAGPSSAPVTPTRQAGATAAAETAVPRPASGVRPAPGRPAHPIADPAPARPVRPTPAGATVESVTIDGDEDLQAFVRSLVTRLESPRDRLAIKAGRLRFILQRSAAPVGAAGLDDLPAVRVPRGAVTERHVREAHADGTRLVLARAAVLTPLARETARTLGVRIEREAQC